MIPVRWLILLAAFVGIAGSASGAPVQSEDLTPFVGRIEDYHCRSIVLNQANIVGFLSMERENDMVDGYLLYRSGARQLRVAFRMLRSDAKALHAEVNALLSRLRSRPIRVEADRGSDGDCRIVQVVG